MRRILVCALIAAAACSNEPLPEQTVRTQTQPQSFHSEEEVFGNLHGFTGTAYYAQLATRDSQSAANQPTYQDQEMWATATGHYNKGAYFGWFGYGSAYPECKSLTSTSSNATEEHSDISGQLPDTAVNEKHCVNVGRLQLLFGTTADFAHPLTIGSRTFERPVDWVNYPYILSAVGGYTPYVEDTLLGNIGNSTNDVELTFDSVNETHSITAAITADAVVRVSDGPWGNTTLNAGDTLKGPSNFWFRFGAWGSTGKNASDPSLLVRYFWDYGANKTDRSGFVDSYLVTALARVKKFAQGTHTVIAQLAAGDQYGADSDGTWGTTKQFYVNAYTPLTAVISPNLAYIAVAHALSLSDIGSNGAGGNSYTWRFGDGTGGTGNPPASHTYSTLGTYTDSLTKTDTHGYAISTTGAVHVVTAPTYSIHGQYVNQSGAVQSNQSCRFNVVVTNGGGPSTYQWFLNGSPAGTLANQSVNVGTSAFTLKVIVTNAGVTDSATKTVGVSGSGQVCA